MYRLEHANAVHLWSILCQSATIDAATNDLSLIRTVDEISVTFPHTEALQAFRAAAEKKPVAAPMPCELVTLWKKIDRSKDSRFEVRVTLKDPEGTILHTVDAPTVMEPGKSRHRNRFSIPAVPMTIPGEYTFVIAAKTADGYETVAEVPLDISFKLESKDKK